MIRVSGCLDAFLLIVPGILHDDDFCAFRKRPAVGQHLSDQVARARTAGAGIREQDQRFFAGFHIQRESVVFIFDDRQRLFRDLPLCFPVGSGADALPGGGNHFVCYGKIRQVQNPVFLFQLQNPENGLIHRPAFR